jgi:hypothetical protein
MAHSLSDAGALEGETGSGSVPAIGQWVSVMKGRPLAEAGTGGARTNFVSERARRGGCPPTVSGCIHV